MKKCALLFFLYLLFSNSLCPVKDISLQEIAKIIGVPFPRVVSIKNGANLTEAFNTAFKAYLEKLGLDESLSFGDTSLSSEEAIDISDVAMSFRKYRESGVRFLPISKMSEEFKKFFEKKIDLHVNATRFTYNNLWGFFCATVGAFLYIGSCISVFESCAGEFTGELFYRSFEKFKETNDPFLGVFFKMHDKFWRDTPMRLAMHLLAFIFPCLIFLIKNAVFYQVFEPTEYTIKSWDLHPNAARIISNSKNKWSFSPKALILFGMIKILILFITYYEFDIQGGLKKIHAYSLCNFLEDSNNFNLLKQVMDDALLDEKEKIAAFNKILRENVNPAYYAELFKYRKPFTLWVLTIAILSAPIPDSLLMK